MSAALQSAWIAAAREGRGRISTGKADTTRIDDACCQRKVCSDAKTVRGHTSTFFACHQRIERCEEGVRSDRDRSSEQDAKLHHEAEHWFHKANEIAPDDANVHMHYGFFLLDAQRNFEAALQFEKAVNIR